MTQPINTFTQKQKGAATLLVTVVLLFVTSLITIYAARIGILEQRTAANETRAQEAFSEAESALDQTFMFWNQYQSTSSGNWLSCDGITTFPCVTLGSTWDVYDTDTATSGAQSFASYIVSDNTVNGYIAQNGSSVRVVGNGLSADSTATATVSQQLGSFTIVSIGSVPPIMAPMVPPSGNITIISNPSHDVSCVYDGSPNVGAARLVPCFTHSDASVRNAVNCPSASSSQKVSIWSEQNLDPAGNAQICENGDFVDNSGTVCEWPNVADEFGNTPTWNQCSCRIGKNLMDEHVTEDDDNDASQYKTGIVDNDGGFPTSVFEYIFGRSDDDLKALASSLGRVYPDCDTLSSLHSEIIGADTYKFGLIWIEGSCDITNSTLPGGVLGSFERPVFLIVDGDFSINGGEKHIWGLMFSLDATPSAALNGGPTVHGTFAAEQPIDIGNGTYNQIYHSCMFENAAGDGEDDVITAKVAGTWIDRL